MTALQEDRDFLAHYGVKGMKWGQRRRDARINTIERVASGHGSKGDKVKVALAEVSPSSVGKNGGLQGAAKVKAANMREVDRKLANGEASVKDVLNRIGGDRLRDSGKLHPNLRMTSEKDRIKTMPTMSKVTKQVVKDHNELSNQQFFQKYATTKKTYARRVAKKGDPYRARVPK